MVLSGGGTSRSMMKEFPAGWNLFLAAVSIWIVWNLKYYWISTFFRLWCTSLVFSGFGQAENSFPVETIPLDHSCFLFLCLCASLLHPNFHPMRILQVVIENNQAFVSHSDPGDVIHYGRASDATWRSVILHSPLGATVGVIQTFFMEQIRF